MQTLECWLKIVVSDRMLILWQELSMLKRKKTGMAVKPKITNQITASTYVRIINWKREISGETVKQQQQTWFQTYKFCTQTYCQADTAPETGAPELSKCLFYGTGGVKTFGQQQQSIQEEEGGQTVDHILKVFYTETHNAEEWRKWIGHNRTKWRITYKSASTAKSWTSLAKDISTNVYVWESASWPPPQKSATPV